MKMTKINQDYLEIDETNLENVVPDRKIHLIKLNFSHPTLDLCKKTISKFETTNRFIVSENIWLYNTFFKSNNKKYYVENTINDECILKFIKKHNKILLNFDSLSNLDFEYISLTIGLVLPIVEVVKANIDLYKKHKHIFDIWPGDFIILE